MIIISQVHIRAFSICSLLFASMSEFSPAHAIAITKPTLTVTAKELAAGVAFPVVGTNDQSGPVFLSVRVYRWKQSADEPIILEPAPEITTFPALVRVDPAQTQNVRIQATAPLTEGRELYYRIVIDEFETRNNEAPSVGVSMAVRNKPRVSVPIVVSDTNASQTPGSLIANFADNTDRRRVNLQNPGSTFVLVRSASTGGEKIATVQVVLAGANTLLSLPMSPTVGQQITLQYQVNERGSRADRSVVIGNPQ